MGILDQGCTCDSCSKITLTNLQDARDKWNNGNREIIFKPYHHTCGDGCCDDYGTDVYVNGLKLTGDGENIESVIESLIEFLSIENVDIYHEYEDEDE